MKHKILISISSAIVYFIITISFDEPKTWPSYMLTSIFVGLGVYLIGTVSDKLVPYVVNKVLRKED